MLPTHHPHVTIIKPGPNYYVSGSRARKAGGTNGNFDAVVVSSAVFVGAGVVEWGGWSSSVQQRPVCCLVGDGIFQDHYKSATMYFFLYLLVSKSK